MKQYNNLYLYGFSSRNSRQLNRLYSLLNAQKNENEQTGLILIHDGVIGILNNNNLPEIMKMVLNLPVDVLALEPDLKARGIPTNLVHDKIKLITYDDLVDIMDQSEELISWM